MHVLSPPGTKWCVFGPVSLLDDCWDRLIRKWRGNSNHSRRKINLNLRQSQAIAVQMEPGFQITSNVLESQLCTKELECIFSPHNKYANEDAAMY